MLRALYTNEQGHPGQHFFSSTTYTSTNLLKGNRSLRVATPPRYVNGQLFGVISYSRRRTIASNSLDRRNHKPFPNRPLIRKSRVVQGVPTRSVFALENRTHNAVPVTKMRPCCPADAARKLKNSTHDVLSAGTRRNHQRTSSIGSDNAHVVKPVPHKPGQAADVACCRCAQPQSRCIVGERGAPLRIV
jgi:hypothetical protein